MSGDRCPTCGHSPVRLDAAMHRVKGVIDASMAMAVGILAEATMDEEDDE